MAKINAKTFNLKSLTLAHNQIGIIISTLVLMIFITGTFSVFRPELNNLQWQLSEVDGAPNEKSPGLNGPELLAHIKQAQLVDIADNDSDDGAQVKIIYPDDRAFYYRLVVKYQGNEEHYTFAASDGRLLANSDRQSFADLVFALHTHLLLPAGKFVVGLAGLLLLFVLQSGLIIHFRQIKRQLFKFRPQKDKDKWLDLHKLFGLVALPFSYTVTLTGVIFNLLLIFQVAFVMLIYQGDIKSLLSDAGYYQVETSEPIFEKKPVVQVLDIEALEALVADKSLKSLTINNYGLSNAYVQLDKRTEAFAPSHYDIYALSPLDSSGQLIYSSADKVNAMSFGVEVMKLLHVGHYGGTATQVLYFLLGLCCCLLVYAGMRLWLNRQYQGLNKQSQWPMLKPKVLALIDGVFVLSGTGLMACLSIGTFVLLIGLGPWLNAYVVDWPIVLMLFVLVVVLVVVLVRRWICSPSVGGPSWRE